MADRHFFGTDGVRGRVGEPPITPEIVLRLGCAAGRVLAQAAVRKRDDRPGVLIGKDTRLSGYMLEAALEAGFASAGVDVYLSGPLPTPAVAYLTRALRLSAGVVISASHNPYDDNGIKFFSANGAKLPDEIEAAIERAMGDQLACARSSELGKAFRVSDAAGRYIEFCKSTFPNERDLRGLRIVVDCAHGAAYHVAPPVFHELGADVIPVANEPSGTNINQSVGAMHPAHLADCVRAERADFGIALDGDGDRVVMCDGSGRVYDGDELLYVIVRDYQRRGVLAGGVVGTQMTNLGFEQAVARAGLSLVRARVGDRYVLEELVRRRWQLGGENSGHLICLDKHSTGDGIIAALAVLRALIEQGSSLAEATADVPLFAQQLINVPIRRGWDWQGSDAVREAESAALASLGRSGRVLLRPSGTEPVLRVMVEASERELAERCAQSIAQVVAQAAGQQL